MNSLYQELESALVGYFDAVEKQRSASESERPPLRPHFEKLDALTKQLPSNVDSQLRHYMKQKSYEKALNFVHGRADLNKDGDCTRSALMLPRISPVKS
jgi:hypothetical protein